MPEIKRQSYHDHMEGPPPWLISHEITHLSPPEKMSEGIDCGYAQQMNDPPASPQKTDLP